ncbi:MAG: hypothetical protein ACJAZ3_001572 [Sphingobacteriales bacterium]|jgi:hypothetical protein
MKSLIKNSFLIAIATVVITSCTKPDSTEFTECGVPLGYDYSNGVYFVNEGGFGLGNGSIDHLLANGTVINQVFNKTTCDSLGDVVQSIAKFNNRLYIPVNGSGKVVVLNATNLNPVSTIEGFSSPRFFLGFNDKIGYVSDWASNTVKAIDLEKDSITSEFQVGNSPNEMIKVGDEIFVCNSGAFGEDSTISVISTTSISQAPFITSKYKNASAVGQDKDGMLWFLFAGNPGFFGTASPAALVKINPSTKNVLAEIQLDSTSNPVRMAISTNGDYVYYLGGFTGPVYRIGLSETVEATEPFISGDFYGLGFDAVGQLYLSDAKDFSQKGEMKVYAKNSTMLVKSYTTGVNPNGISSVQ